MSVPTLTPEEANDSLNKDGAATYVDVRTVAEFAKGHPKGKIINVPIVFFHPTTDEVFPNESFDLVMEDVCPKDTPLIVGCEKGPRAKKAVDRLTAAGYENVSLMEAGHAGWKAASLPITADNRDGISYVSLLTPAKRKNEEKEKSQALTTAYANKNTVRSEGACAAVRLRDVIGPLPVGAVSPKWGHTGVF